MEIEKEPILPAKNMVSLEDVGKLLKGAREKEGLTQRQLADELNVNAMTISLAETGSKRTGKQLLNKLAVRLGVTFDLTFPYDNEAGNQK